MESSAFNPYAAPEEQTLPDLPADHLAFRQQFIHCESNIKSIAGLMILGGFLVSWFRLVSGWPRFMRLQGPAAVSGYR